MILRPHDGKPETVPNSMELEPWLIIQGEAPDTSVAMWRIDQQDASGVAIFSDRIKAASYANDHCTNPCQIRQLNQRSLIRVLADCYRQGIRYATLNPDDHAARQIFVLRDVLKSARAMLQQTKDDTN